MNYDGNYPYAGSEKGLYRKETVDVGSFEVADSPYNEAYAVEVVGDLAYLAGSSWLIDRRSRYGLHPGRGSHRSGRANESISLRTNCFPAQHPLR